MNISVDSPKVKFEEHLSQPENNRILFSGKFGTGKSHFLKEFFKIDDVNSNYNVFWISPVNYVVGANQDIFEWIKVDIAKELLFNYVQTTKNKKDSKNFLIQSFIYQNASKIFDELCLSVAKEVSEKKTGVDFLDTFKKYITDYRKFEEEVEKNNQSDGEKLENFVQTSLLSKGSLFEDDLTTQIIRANIELLRYKTNKKSVLIIDDLDRLDPEHIFRILNILSCHNNHFDSNKFGFDKVILVCDIHNIELIYMHKYGEADFEGYIEKFYTYEPFYYSLKAMLMSYCSNEVIFGEIDTHNIKTLSLLLMILLKENLLKVRNIKKIFSLKGLTSGDVSSKTYTVNFTPMRDQGYFIDTNELTVNFQKFGFLKVLKILIVACGGVNEFKRVLNSINHKTDQYEIDNNIHLFNSIAILSALSKNNTTGNSNVFFDNSEAANYSYTRNGDMNYPTVDCFQISARINLKWNAGCLYTNGHYFDEAFIADKSATKEPIEVGKIIREIDSILVFLISEKIITNLPSS